MKNKRYQVFRTRNRLVQALQRRLVVALFSHWLFQSWFYMDTTERVAKLGFSIGLFGLALVVLGPSTPAILAAAVLAHTINFLLNAHPLVVLKSFGISRTNEAGLARHVVQLKRRISMEPSIAWAALYGSFARGELHKHSDLDVRCVRRPGLLAAVRAIWFAVRERTTATFAGVPLDLYVFDSGDRLDRMAKNEVPVQLKSPET